MRLIGINMINLTQQKDQIPKEFEKIAKDFSEKGFITTSSENLIEARDKSLTNIENVSLCNHNVKLYIVLL